MCGLSPTIQTTLNPTNTSKPLDPGYRMRLSKGLGTSVELWLNLQLAWDLYEAQHSPKAKEIDRLEKIA